MKKPITLKDAEQTICKLIIAIMSSKPKKKYCPSLTVAIKEIVGKCEQVADEIDNGFYVTREDGEL